MLGVDLMLISQSQFLPPSQPNTVRSALGTDSVLPPDISSIAPSRPTVTALVSTACRMPSQSRITMKRPNSFLSRTRPG